MSKRAKIIGVVVGVGILAIAGVAFASGGDDKPKPPIPPRPPVPPKPKPRPKPGPGPGPDVPTPPADFDPDGPAIWISPDCEEIVVGARFIPHDPLPDRNPWLDDEGRYQFDPATAKGRSCRVLDMRGLAQPESASCTGLDYVDTLIIEEGQTDPVVLADMIFSQLSPLCADAPPDTWGAAVFDWRENLIAFLVEYVELKQAWLDEQEAIGWEA